MFNPDVLIAVRSATSQPDDRPIGQLLSILIIRTEAARTFNSSPPSRPLRTRPYADTLGEGGVAWTGLQALSLISISEKE